MRSQKKAPCSGGQTFLRDVEDEMAQSRGVRGWRHVMVHGLKGERQVSLFKSGDDFLVLLIGGLYLSQGAKCVLSVVTRDGSDS